MALTKRDLILLEKLNRFSMLSTRQLHQSIFCGLDRSTVLRRLRILEKKGLIKRIKGLDFGEMAWILMPDGGRKIGIHIQQKAINKNNLDHDILLSSLRLRLESIGVGKTWISEDEMRRKIGKEKQNLGYSYRHLIPDGLLTEKFGGEFKSIAFELEISPKTKKRYREIFSEYKEKKHFHILWYVVSNKNLFNLLSEIWKKDSWEKPHQTFVLSFLDELLSDPLKAKWHFDGKSFPLERINFDPSLSERILSKVPNGCAQPPDHTLSKFSDETKTA